MRKMLHYISSDTLLSMCGLAEDGTPRLFPSQLVEVMAAVLDSEVCIFFSFNSCPQRADHVSSSARLYLQRW